MIYENMKKFIAFMLVSIMMLCALTSCGTKSVEKVLSDNNISYEMLTSDEVNKEYSSSGYDSSNCSGSVKVYSSTETNDYDVFFIIFETSNKEDAETVLVQANKLKSILDFAFAFGTVFGAEEYLNYTVTCEILADKYVLLTTSNNVKAIMENNFGK